MVNGLRFWTLGRSFCPNAEPDTRQNGYVFAATRVRPSALLGTDFLPATKQNIVSADWLTARKTLENHEVETDTPSVSADKYPISVLWDGIGVVEAQHGSDLIERIRAVLRAVWANQADAIEGELCDLLGVPDLEMWLQQPNRFFTRHLAQYTQNKRQSPIYLPLSIPSGNYTIWLYYPKITEQTLYKVLTDYIAPKQKTVQNDIRSLENNPNLDGKGQKQLNDCRQIAHELEDMKNDLAQLAPQYQPNLDDGVLITACPLWRYFRQPKWRKACEETWRSLDKGEYDWARLAMGFRRDQVRKKCVHDLSIAIAHDLENLCELQPKEKKTRKKRTLEQNTAIMLDL